VEFTNRGDQAHLVFAELMSYAVRECPQLILGIGSIVDALTAALYIQCGANFVVGPVLNAEVARLCNRRKVAYCPGCGSAGEISAAEELGVEIVKLFPAQQVGGPAFVKAMLGPCPWTSIMPTGGVDATRESLSVWFKAGIVCAGLGSKLITKELLAAGDFDGLAAKVRQVIAWVGEVRSEKLG
jgi:2-dehydro-3-deoxyphosphogluconate aldolase/(4S)-4-hydroxy-2-oxoglutarate aldolase